MTALTTAKYAFPTKLEPAAQSAPGDQPPDRARADLERGVYAALETYANVHRGSGHNSLVSTHLYEQARDIVLEYLELSKDKYAVIFCTPRRAELLRARIDAQRYRLLSSDAIGLPLGVRALAVERSALARSIPFETGGGTARLVSPGWVVWAKAPDRFEPGTPAIVNVIAFARALRLLGRYGQDSFSAPRAADRTPAEILYADELVQASGRALLESLRQTTIGGRAHVPTIEGDRPYINLDNGASTPTFAPIWDTVCQTWRQPATVQQAIVEEVKAICARTLAAPESAYEVIFAANTTEAINLVAESLGNEFGKSGEAVVLNTFLEHNSNELPWRRIPGIVLIRLPVDDEGFVDLEALETSLRAYNAEGQHGQKRVALVTVSGASNVLGTCNDLAEISGIVHRYGARLLVDAAQLVAHRAVDMETWGIDYLAFSAHKVYAPFGAGVLIARKGLLVFDPEERARIRSSGEENTVGIAALGKALVLLQRIGLDVIQQEEQALTAQVLRGLAQIPGIMIYGITDPSSPGFARKGGVIIFDLKGVLPGRVAQALAERGGIGVRSGCHCAHLLVKRILSIPWLLQQFQGVILTLFPQLALPGVVRVSLGMENTAEEIDTLLQVLDRIARQPRAGTASATTAVADLRAEMDALPRTAAARVYA